MSGVAEQTSAIEVSVTAVEPTATVEQIAEAWTLVESLIRRASEYQRVLREKCIDWLKANYDKDLRWVIDEDGHEMVLYLGHSKSVKCRDVRKAIQAILEIEGDWEAAAGCLSSSAVKHGAARKYFIEKGRPELFDQLFETVVKDKLETGEPAPKELQSFDNRFVR